MGPGNKLQRQKMGPWSFGERRIKVTHLGGRRGGRESNGGIKTSSVRS